MNFKSIVILFCLLTACNRQNQETKSQEKMSFVIRNMNSEPLNRVYIKTDFWHSDTIDVDANSDGVIYRDLISGEFHEGYSVVFGQENNDYGYGDYTTTIPSSESFLITFHGDTVRIAAFHIE